MSVIKNREEFGIFLKSLNKDYEQNSKAWTNNDLASFLEAMSAWVEDMDGYYINQGKTVPQQIDWDVARDMFLAAKTYE